MNDALSLADFGRLVGGRVESIEPIGATVQIDRAYLEGEITSLQKQKNDALATVHQADGAIAAYRALIARLDEPEPSPETDNAQGS